MNAIELTKKDHREVEKLFKQFEKTTDRASKTRRELVDKMIAELVKHSMVEEEFLYPALRKRGGKAERQVLLSLEEHHVVKWQLLELHRLDVKDERFEAKVKVLIDNVRHHVEEEEDVVFKLLRQAFDAKELADLGAQMEGGKATAPTRPHPRAPDTPPGNLLAGSLAAVMDRARDLLSGRGERRAPKEVAARTARKKT